MISLEDFKKALGTEVEKLTEEQIIKLREQQDNEAEIFFNMWLENTQKIKNEV